MALTQKIMEGRGKIYQCRVDWENKNLSGAYPFMEFDAQTLDELLKDDLSACPTPFMSNLYYIIEK